MVGPPRSSYYLSLGQRLLIHQMIADARRGATSTVELLFQLGSTAIDTPDDSGATSLFYAVLNEHVEPVELLLRCGSQTFDIPDNRGRTPLWIAILHNSAPLVAVLRAVGAVIPESLRDRAESAHLPKPMEDDMVLEIRHRIYFSRSLLSRLL